MTFFKIGVLKNFAVFTGKHCSLRWGLSLIKLQAFRPLLKRDSNTGVFLWILQTFWEQLFYRTPATAASEGLYDWFFTGKCPDSGKLYQQLELEFLNQRSCWDVYACFIVLLNFQYIMLNMFNKNSIKSILIHECQHKSTRINTSQHESTRVRHESTQVRHESTRVN